MAAIHDAHPDKPLYMSECSTGPTGIAGDTSAQVLAALGHWASGAVLWNIALDPSGGPKMGVGCVGCTGLVTIDPATGGYEYTVNYYELGQFSAFVAPGAQRVQVGGAGNVAAQAFRNPDGTDTVVAYNPGGSPETFEIAWGSAAAFGYTLPAGATVTFTTSDAAR
jgi:glucosylceramidase